MAEEINPIDVQTKQAHLSHHHTRPLAFRNSELRRSIEEMPPEDAVLVVVGMAFKSDFLRTIKRKLCITTRRWAISGMESGSHLEAFAQFPLSVYEGG